MELLAILSLLGFSFCELFLEMGANIFMLPSESCLLLFFLWLFISFGIMWVQVSSIDKGSCHN